MLLLLVTATVNVILSLRFRILGLQLSEWLSYSLLKNMPLFEKSDNISAPFSPIEVTHLTTGAFL